jgi:L-threonylcarbamoyladenylate synthase
MRIFSFQELLTQPACFQQLVHELKHGSVLAFPTDTLYGFAVDADSVPGVERLYEIKGREEHKPLILFVSDLERLTTMGIPLSDAQRSLLEKFWPGGFTGVFPAPSGTLQAFSHSTLGIRVPKHEPLREFLRQYPGWLLTTSANRSGQPPLFSGGEIAREFAGEVAAVIDEGQLPLSEPSTVADMTTWPPIILRQGKIRL